MEERKLDFNAPFMSVRRFSMVSSSTGENVIKAENSLFSRWENLPVSESDSNLDQVTEPVAVPFHWEQIPGRPKNDSRPDPKLPQLQSPERTVITPHLFLRKALNVTNSDDQTGTNTHSLVKLESSKDGMSDREDSSSDKDEDVYSDAHDTLSPTDSFSLNNCSVSGLSGYEGLDIKPSRTFSVDPQTRDFMMSRFLPAAKAMTIKPSQYSSRKQLVVAIKQPRQEAKKPLLKQDDSALVVQYDRYEEEEESEIDDDDYDESGSISAKGCELLPGLCLKNSLGLLNPMMGMKMRAQSPVSTIYEAGRSGRTTYARSHSQIIDKNACEISLPKLKEVKDKWIDESKLLTSSGELQTRGRSSPFRHSRGASPFRNQLSQSPRGMRLYEVPKNVENFKTNRFHMNSRGTANFQAVLSRERNEHESDWVTNENEKTLYVDTVNFSNVKGSLSSMVISGKEEATTTESYLHNAKYPINFSGRSLLEPEVSIESQLAFMTDQELESNSNKSSQNSKPAVDETQYKNGEDVIVKEEKDTLNASLPPVQSPLLPPPLPKSPSESWLWRTMPSVSSKNLFSGTNLSQSKKQDLNTSSSSKKWETIVKTSNLHHDHVRYSKELVTRVSEHSET